MVLSQHQGVPHQLHHGGVRKLPEGGRGERLQQGEAPPGGGRGRQGRFHFRKLSDFILYFSYCFFLDTYNVRSSRKATVL